MKYKNKVKRLQAAIQWYERQNQQYQNAHKKPGSIKHR